MSYRLTWEERGVFGEFFGATDGEELMRFNLEMYEDGSVATESLELLKNVRAVIRGE